MKAALGQSVIVENRPGPPAPSATGRVARAAPDESVSRWRTDGSAKVSRGVKAGDVAEDGPLQTQWLRQTNVWRGGTSPHGSQKRLRSVKSATKINDGSREGWDEMVHDPREDPEVVVNTFLQHKSLEQMQDYLARGRRFAKLDTQRLNKGWIIAVRGWLANKYRTNERQMDDLAAELRLRGFEPPYGAVEQDLANREL
jgi:hypothetical protein